MMTSLGDIWVERKLGRILIDTTLEQREDLTKLIQDIEEQINLNTKLQVLVLEASEVSKDDLPKAEPEVVLKTESNQENNYEADADQLYGHPLESENEEGVDELEPQPKTINVRKGRKPNSDKGHKHRNLKGVDPEGDHICDLCGAVVQGISDYRKHKRNHRLQVKRHSIVTKTCKHCHQELVLTESKFKSHEWSCQAKHVVTNDYICNICGKALPTAYRLNSHHRICSGRITEWKKQTNYVPPRRKCPHEGCDYSASAQSQVLNHINTVHLKRDSHSHVCNECGNAYTQPQHLRSHVKTVHRNIRPHMCQEDGCGKSFSRAAHLKSHMDIHLGIRSHQCSLCGKSFTHDSTLFRHKQSCVKHESVNVKS